DHHGLEKVKKRVLQFLAVRKLRGDLKGPILCLFGPPGVGKTSLGQSVAKAMGRKFVRVSLGGVRDEAEIRGPRRTYVAARRDRMEIIEIPSYTLDEKRAIAREHLWPKQLEAHGLSGAQVTLTDEALARIVTAHTREAGVRSLEKRLADVCRSLAVEKASGTL